MNFLLAELTSAERKRLDPFLEPVALKMREVLMEADESIRYVYFPVNVVASVVQSMSDGSTVETGIIGREGMVGVPAWLRQKKAPPARIFVQVPGTAYRMKRETFVKEVVNTHSAMNDCIAPYVNAFLTQTAMTAACNRIHRVETRLCRWLKMVHNRVDGDTFAMRHEFLSYMLGVHRPSISIAAAALKKAGLISYERGILTVLDSEGLARNACECYTVVETQFEKIFKCPFRK